MKDIGNNPIKALAFSLVGMWLAAGGAQAEPAPYSKAATFTASIPTTTPATGSRHYPPANTKYSNVKLTRAGNEVATETRVSRAHDVRVKPAPEAVP
jgi:hypothetical protein